VHSRDSAARAAPRRQWDARSRERARLTMVNNVIGGVNYMIAARPSLRNFMIADREGGTAVCAKSSLAQPRERAIPCRPHTRI
jgi:hypothetical protein